MDNAHPSTGSTASVTHAPKEQSSDFTAALTGLVVGGCVLFALVFGIVEMTNHMYAGESTAGPAATAPATTAPATTAPATTAPAATAPATTAPAATAP